MSQRRRIARSLRVVSQTGDTADVYVEGVIGSKDGTTAASFREQLARAKGAKVLRVHFNSVGGSVTQGTTIYNNLRALDVKKIGIVDGIAASIASVILMACDERRVAKGAYVMIHNPSVEIEGGADELRKAADDMTTMRGELLDIYETRTGIERAKLEKLLDAETYFTAEEAVTMGIADSIEDFEARVMLDAVAKLDPSKVPAGLLASAQGKAKAMSAKAKKMKALEEKMDALKAEMAECEESEDDDKPDDEEDDDKPDDEEDDEPTAEEEEEEKKNILATVKEITGAKTFTQASAQLALKLSRSHSSAATSRADLVSAAVKAGKLDPSLKAMALRCTDRVFATLLKGMGGVTALKLGGKHRQPVRSEEEIDPEKPTEAELKSAKAMGITDPKLIIAARTQPMVYGKAGQ